MDLPRHPHHEPRPLGRDWSLSAATGLLCLLPLPGQDAEPASPAALCKAIARLPLRPAPQDGFRLRVVDRNGRPIAAAAVVCYPQSFAEELVLPPMQPPVDGVLDPATPHLRRALARGFRFETGADGRVALPVFSSGTLLVVHQDRFTLGGYSARDRQAEGEELQLGLRPRRGIYVRAVDHRGNPADRVPVGIVLGPDPRRVGLPVSAPRRVHTRFDTNKYGLVFFPDRHLQYVRDDRRSRWRVEAWIPAKAPIGIPLPGPGFRNTLATALELKLPPTGQVRVYCRGEDGQPVTGQVQVFIRQTKRAGNHGVSFIPRQSLPGVWDLPHVGLGVAVEATCRVDGVPRSQKVRDAGPSMFREMRILTIEDLVRPPRLRLKLRGFEVLPAGQSELRVIFQTGKRAGQTKAQVAADGSAVLIYPEELRGREDAMVWLRTAAGPEARLTLAALRRLPEIELRPGPVRLRVRVVDTAGRPVAGAMMSARGGQNRSKPFAGTRHHTLIVWAETDAEGLAELRSADPEIGRLALSAGGQDMPGGGRLIIKEGLWTQAGRAMHKLVVLRPGALVGKLVGHPGIQGQVVIFELEAEAEPAISTRRGVRVQGTTRFKLQDLHPGRYRLSLRLAKDRSKGLSLGSVEVKAGEAWTPQQLELVDLAKARTPGSGKR